MEQHEGVITITSDRSTWSSVDPQSQHYMKSTHGQFKVLNLKRPYGPQVEQLVGEKWPAQDPFVPEGLFNQQKATSHYCLSQ